MQFDYKQCKCCKCGQDISSRFTPRCTSHNTTEYDEVPQRLSKSHDEQRIPEVPIGQEASSQGFNRGDRPGEAIIPGKRNGLDEDGYPARIQQFKRCFSSCPYGPCAPRETLFDATRVSNHSNGLGNIEADSVLISWPTNMDREVMVIPTCQGREVAAMSCSSLAAYRCTGRNLPQPQSPNADAPARSRLQRQDSSRYSGTDGYGPRYSGGPPDVLPRPGPPNSMNCRKARDKLNRLGMTDDGYDRPDDVPARLPDVLSGTHGGMPCGTTADGLCQRARDNLNRMSGANEDRPDERRAEERPPMNCGQDGRLCSKARANLQPEEPVRKRGGCPCSVFGDDGSDCGPCDQDFADGDLPIPRKANYSEDRSYMEQPEEQHVVDPWMYNQQVKPVEATNSDSDFSMTPSVYVRQQMARPSLKSNSPQDKSRRVAIMEKGVNTEPEVKPENKCLSFMKKLFGRKNGDNKNKKKKNKKPHRHR